MSEIQTELGSVASTLQHYTRAELEVLPRDPELRNLARSKVREQKLNVSLSWIGSMASKSDLIAFLLGEGEARGSKDLDHSGNGQNGKADAAALMAQAVAAIAAQSATSVDTDMLEDRLECLKNGLREEFEALVASQPKPLRVEVVQPEGKVINCGLQHKQFPVLLKLLSAGVNVALVGPAGSGKTRAAHEAAKALGLEFEALSVGPQTTQSQLMGYMDANGNYVATAFRRRFEFGGVILLDEFDASNAGVGTCINAATANSGCGFPDRYVLKHDASGVVVSMNTFGTGADRQYVGRNQLDAATLDRFVFVEWNYDEQLERAIALGVNPEAGLWVDRVQALRANVTAQGLRVVISPRASEIGAKLLLAGFDLPQLEQTLIFKGHDAATVAKIKGGVA